LCADQKWIQQAPIFLGWCADLSRLDRICGMRGYKQVTNYVENFLVAVVDAALATYDRAMIETGIYKGHQVPVPGRQEEMTAYGWLEHSARRASKELRTELRQVLAEQGFDLK
jgi:hypothetical protein